MKTGIWRASKNKVALLRPVHFYIRSFKAGRLSINIEYGLVRLLLEMGRPKNLRWKTRIGLAVAFGLTVATASIAPAQATLQNYGMPTRSMVILHAYPAGINTTAFNQARAAWNNAGVGAKISSGPGKNTLNFGSYTANWFGVYTPSGKTAATRTFTIQVNVYLMQKSVSAAKYPSWLRSTTTHEIGHALSLADNPPKKPTESLMRHDRDRSKIHSPTAYDKSEVKRAYK